MRHSVRPSTRIRPLAFAKTFAAAIGLWSAQAFAADAPVLSLEDGAAREDARDLVVTARLSKPATWPVVAGVYLVPEERQGVAQYGVDYLPPPPQVVFMPGETEIRIVISLKNDREVEGDETLQVALGRIQGAYPGRARALAVIQDDDGGPRFQQAQPQTARLHGILSTRGGQIVNASGRPVRLHGVNWFGLETPNFAPHGSWTRGWRQMMHQMRDLGFNVIRLPYSNDLLRDAGEPNGVDFHKNSDFRGLTGLQIMDKIIAYAGAIGMNVLLDNHRITAGHGAQASGLWHSAAFSEDQWVEDLKFLADRYKHMSAVVGIDLFNEPHGPARWGGGGRNDWRRAAERGGNAVLAVNPNWLIVVEGVAKAAGSHYWDGGNLAGVRRHKVRLSRPDKLVYSTHVYPASVYNQPWLRGRGFERGLPEVWRKHWAFLFQQREAPVWIGEFGSHMKTHGDRVWMSYLAQFLARPSAEGRVAWTYWSWNPNSGDTGGILKDDWNTTHANKLAAIRPMMPGASPIPGRNIAGLPAGRGNPG